MSAGEITVVGLGPGSPHLLTLETAEALRWGRVFLRTRIHPTIEAMPESSHWASFDRLYEEAPDFGTLYRRIVDELIAASAQGPLVYAVPGSPLLAESTVRLLREAARERGVPLRVLPAVSFVDVVADALGIDPVASDLQLVDALDLAAYVEREPFAGGTLPLSNLRPALIAQVYSQAILSNVKLALLTNFPPDLQLTLVTAAGTPTQTVEMRPLSRLDHGPANHLSTLYVPAVEPLAWPRSSDAVRRIVARLRAPGGCPWDREQTHQSLTRYLLEEAHEAVEALEADDCAAVEEELGDVLLQVYLHAQLAEELGEFSLDDIYQSLGSKLVRRHPHVFGERVAETAGAVIQTWNEVKQQEKAARAGTAEAPDETLARRIFGSIPASLPALSRAQAIYRRARSHALDEGWPATICADGSAETLAAELAAMVSRAEQEGIDAEQSLRGWLRAFERSLDAAAERDQQD